MNNENKRHQVFISSTFNDLKQERAEVTQALLELDCIPCGMEAFPAANETQWNWIKRVIEECDYYVLIIGGKYGSVNDETGLSYTEMEYDYANEKDIPTIAFIIEDEDKILGDKLESDLNKKEKLKLFKEKVKKNLCKFYTTPEDLGGKVSRSITQLKKTNPRIGWVRADSFKNYSSNEEVIRLMKENEELKDKFNIYNSNSFIFNKDSLAKEDELFNVEYGWSYSEHPFGVTDSGKKFIQISWKKLFEILGGAMVNENINLFNGKDPLSNYIYEIEAAQLFESRRNFSPIDGTLGFSVKQGCLTRILMQFRTLGYIDVDNRKWSLTERGLHYLATTLLVKSQN